MRYSTKVIAFAWILISIVWLVVDAVSLKETISVRGGAGEIISVVAELLLTVIILVSAVALVRGKRIGWWMVLTLNGLAALVSLAFIFFGFALNTTDFAGASKYVAVIAAILMVLFGAMFVLLLQDRPSRWSGES